MNFSFWQIAVKTTNGSILGKMLLYYFRTTKRLPQYTEAASVARKYECHVVLAGTGGNPREFPPVMLLPCCQLWFQLS